MRNPTTFDPTALEQWLSNEEHAKLFEETLYSYLHQFDPIFKNQSQIQFFHTLLKGLLSSLKRKSLEPIALHFLGEKAVRGLQQFLSRAPYSLEALSSCYCALLAQQLTHPGGMISVDDTSFVKKGTHSAGVKRQYCGRIGKTENCQVGVFLAYASDAGYGLWKQELYLPQDWFSPSYEERRKECQIPEDRLFATKNQIALQLLQETLQEDLLQIQWVGCDASYGSDHTFLDAWNLPEHVWYFVSIHSTELVFLEYPTMEFPPTTRGRPRKHPILSVSPVQVQTIANDSSIPWETIVLMDGAKGPVYAERKCIRCYASRSDPHRNYVGVGEAVWLYLRKYEDNTIKYFLSSAPEAIAKEELDRAATLRWPIEQCFEECKSNLGMGDYECRSYPAWKRQMQFVEIAHLFTTKIKAWYQPSGIPLTVPMIVKLLEEIIVYSVTCVRKIVCYYIKRNHIAYVSHCKKKIQKYA